MMYIYIYNTNNKEYMYCKRTSHPVFQTSKMNRRPPRHSRAFSRDEMAAKRLKISATSSDSTNLTRSTAISGT